MERNDGLVCFGLLDQGQTTLRVLVNGDTVQALEALAVINLTGVFNRLVFAFVTARLARRTAFFAPGYP